MPFMAGSVLFPGNIAHEWLDTRLLLGRFDFSRKKGEAGDLEARETGDEHARDHGKERGDADFRFVNGRCHF